ncbi:AAA family ATPase [Candidatus Parabeggiatoa sp. HSG14]|uniref:AAA family ATPase n=1 Tax=Candidatus Parabeggiatoa sp. HSG14 TaxID=3055593 RepID=UPI0025A89F65|nr:AAA family ATPase [Thiotrichales bacterium HSG14]
MLKLPYGFSDFYLLRRENYFYVDRSSHIRVIEEAGHQLLFLRPRRFGKSLLLSMLENYYDVLKASEFERLFGELAIGKNPTEKHNQYLVMKWDFSNVNPEGGTPQIQERLYNYINRCIQDFANNYQTLLLNNIEIEPDDAIISFLSLLSAVRQTPYRLYLLIDEYDSFANDLMMGQGQTTSPERYKTLLSTEGSLKALFRAVKSASSGAGLERVFITGVSPVLMSDITSAYNVAKNIYFEPEFNDLCGFQEVEIKAALTQIADECGFDSDKIRQSLDLIRTFYDGYRFSELGSKDIYNPTLALYFFDSFQKNCRYPRQMLDDNLAMDLSKLTYLSRLPNGRTIIRQALDGTPPLVLSLLANRFSVVQMLKTTQSNQFIISLLYYLGILTLDGRTPLRKMRFKIPNLVVRKLYVEHLFEMLLPQSEREEVRLLAEDFYQSGDLQPVCDFMEQRYFKVFDNRDYTTANELTIKTAFMTALFNDVWYMMDSEKACQRRYTDLTMLIRPDFRELPLYDFILEFKYLKLADVKLSGAELKKLSQAELEALEPVKAKLAEAKQQLFDYQTCLESECNEVLKLKLISVVAVGFDRVVWQTVM